MSQRHLSFGRYEISIRRLKENVLSIRFKENKHTGAQPSQLIGDEVRDILLDYKDHNKFSMASYNKLKGEDKRIMDQLLQKSGMDDQLGVRITDDDFANLIHQYEEARDKVMNGDDTPATRKALKVATLQLVRKNKLPMRMSYNMLLELALLD